MRYLYIFMGYLAIPFIFIRIFFRSFKAPAYRQRLGERLGFYPFKFDRCIWVHAVSVGETIAALPLIKALQARYPDLPMLVTTMTPTGAARVQSSLGDSVAHAYLAYDLPDAVSRFLKAAQPVIGIIIETELWPNLLAACHEKKIPVCLLNARLSEKSARGYQRIGSLTRDMLQNLAVIAANGNMDAERFIFLGAPAERVIVTGNIKFDLELPDDLISRASALRDVLGRERFIWIAASTHAGEEEIILAAHKKILEINPHALLIIVPRHPDRFDTVAKLCEQLFKTVRRSQQSACQPDVKVYVGDTMGELLLLYAVADVAFVGGSLIPRGGHNVLEPAVLAKPVLTGPHVFNFVEICDLLFAAKALIKVNDGDELATQLIAMLQHPESGVQMGQRARSVIDGNRGALKKQLELVSSLM